MKEIMHGIAKTAMDHVKDAQMQYDYAIEAEEHGSHEFAALHMAEAKTHLDSAKAWYDRGMKLAGDKLDPVADMMLEHPRAWHRELADKVAKFKPGA